MVTLRVANAKIQADHKLRVSKLTAQGTSTAPKLRAANLTVQGALPLSIPAIPDRTVEAYAAPQITVPGSNYPPGTQFVWRQISGPPVTYADNGTNITFVSPTAMAGTAVVFGVTAQVGSQSSTEVTSTVNVLPHLYWVASDTGWLPLTRKAAA